jgi:hypothetical protein
MLPSNGHDHTFQTMESNRLRGAGSLNSLQKSKPPGIIAQIYFKEISGSFIRPRSEEGLFHGSPLFYVQISFPNRISRPFNFLEETCNESSFNGYAYKIIKHTGLC